MSADLDIHILEGVTPEEYRFSQVNCIFSKHFNIDLCGDGEKMDAVISKIRSTPRMFVGELDSGPNDFEELIMHVVGEDLQIITDELIEKIMSVYKELNVGSGEYWNEKKQFLELHKGKPIFTMVW